MEGLAVVIITMRSVGMEDGKLLCDIPMSRTMNLKISSNLRDFDPVESLRIVRTGVVVRDPTLVDHSQACAVV